MIMPVCLTVHTNMIIYVYMSVCPEKNDHACRSPCHHKYIHVCPWICQGFSFIFWVGGMLSPTKDSRGEWNGMHSQQSNMWVEGWILFSMYHICYVYNDFNYNDMITIVEACKHWYRQTKVCVQRRIFVNGGTRWSEGGAHRGTGLLCTVTPHPPTNRNPVYKKNMFISVHLYIR